MPKNLDACKKAIEKEQKSIEKKEVLVKEKEENKEVALGTSKINYMDPRITISWCKKAETPIEKIFQKTLVSKFAWAMDTEMDYTF